MTYTKCYGVYLDNDDLIFSNQTLIHVRWSPFSIFPMELPNAYNVDIKLLELNLTTEMWSELPLATNISNIGYAGVSIPEVDESATLEGIISPIVISVSLSAGSGSSRILTDLARLDLRPSQNTPSSLPGEERQSHDAGTVHSMESSAAYQHRPDHSRRPTTLPVAAERCCCH